VAIGKDSLRRCVWAALGLSSGLRIPGQTATHRPPATLQTHRWRSSSLKAWLKRLAAGSPDGRQAQARHQTGIEAASGPRPGWCSRDRRGGAPQAAAVGLGLQGSHRRRRAATWPALQRAPRLSVATSHQVPRPGDASRVARAMAAAVSRVMPISRPRAWDPQWGVPQPVKAGTSNVKKKKTGRCRGTVAASASISRNSSIRPSRHAADLNGVRH